MWILTADVSRFNAICVVLLLALYLFGFFNCLLYLLKVRNVVRIRPGVICAVIACDNLRVKLYFGFWWEINVLN